MIFGGFPVQYRRTMKLKLEEIQNIETSPVEQPAPSNSIQTILACLNPFSQFILKEMQTGADSFEKVWELDEVIF